MTESLIPHPKEGQILQDLQTEYFNRYKLYKLGFYIAKAQCVSVLRDVQQYYTCIDKVDIQDKKYHQQLKDSLDSYQAKYRNNMKNCQDNQECHQKQLTQFKENISKIYDKFYSKATVESI